MNLKKTLYIFLCAAFSAYSFAQGVKTESGGIQASDSEGNILSALNFRQNKPCKILVYSRGILSKNPRASDGVNRFLTTLERVSNRRFKLSFTESSAQFKLGNLQNFDCVILNNVSANALAEKDYIKSLPEHLRDFENRKIEKYLSDLKTYISEGGSLFILASDIPPVLGLQIEGPEFSKTSADIPISVHGHQFNNGLWGKYKRFLLRDNIDISSAAGKPRPDVQVLLDVDGEYLARPEKTSVPLAWIKDYGRGKIFYCAFSECEDCWGDSSGFAGFCIRAIQYLSGSFKLEGCSPDAMTSPESAIVYLRNIEDENSSIFKSVSEKINLRISKNPKSKDAVSKICLDEFGADIGTPLYKRFLAGLLSRTSLKENSEILLGEIKRSLPDVKNRKYVESLIRIIGESKDKDAAANLERLLDCDAPEYALVCSLRAVSKIKTPNAAEIAKARAKKLLSENATPKELKEQAVKSLIEVGEEVDLSLVTKDSIGFLGNHRHIQIPKYISFKTLPDELQAPLINALTLRGEAYEDIIRLTAKDSKFALAITSAIVKFGKLDDLRTAFNFAELYSEREADEASSLISSIKGENRLKCIWGIKASLSGRPKELLLKTLSKAPISDGEAEFLLNIISGDNSSEDKLLALSLLQNAGEKCEKIADLAKTRFESSSNPDEKMRCLQLLALNQTDDNARLCILAYRQGFKDLAAQELCKWKTPEILGQIFDLYKTQDAESKKVLENTIYCVLKNSKAFDGEICDFLIENAEDKAIAEKIIKLRRGDLKGFKMIDMPFGIKAAALSDSVKNAFDGDPETRFEAEGELSCFFLEFPNTRMLKALDVNSESKPDSWKIFAGEDLCDMAEIEYAASELSKNKYRLAFKNPHKAKFVKLENIKGSNISEMDFINDSSVYIKDLDRVGKRCIASARDHPGWAKLAFDDMISTSWTGAPNREPGQWFFFGLDKIKDVSGVELLLGKHKDARVIAPKVYAGKYADDMRLVEIDYAELASSDFIKFRSPQNVRFILIENNGLKEGSWRISEIKVQ